MPSLSDNRETCTVLVPSSCVPYTGYISTSIQADMPDCRPNINDTLKAIQELIDRIKAKLGDNTTLDEECLDIEPATVTQKDINQVLITEVCVLKTLVGTLGGPIDPDTILLAVDLLCLIDPSCDPQASYTLTEIITKLVTAYCNLLARVVNIETILNI